jgi:DNA primase catalytic core
VASAGGFLGDTAETNVGVAGGTDTPAPSAAGGVMARVPDTELERLKRDVSVQRLAEARGIALTRHGADLHGLCPFHDDTNPSLVISPERNLWHCLGACQAGGSVIDWVMRSEGVSFRHAVELLRADAPLGTSAKLVKTSTVRRLPAPVSAEADDRAALGQVADYYHATLKESPEALAYLESRGLVSSEMGEHFRLGYANRTLGLRLPERNRKAGEELRGRLERLGVLRESGHEHLAGSLVVPLLDEAGGVVGMYGRKIRNDLKAGTPLHLYLPGPHRGVFNLPAFTASRTMILCEALIDALTFWCAGFRNVTAAYGVEGFTPELLEAFKRHGIEEALIAFDRDEAGDRGAEKVAAALVEAGVTCHRVEFPKGMDANEYALRMKPAAKAFEVALAGAKLMGRGKGRTVAAAAASPASPSPASPPTPSAMAVAPTTSAPGAEVDGDEVRFVFGDRRYRVRGLGRNTAFDCLRVNLLASRGERFHVDTLDVYSARQRAAYVKQAAGELGAEEDVIKADVGKVLIKLEELADAHAREACKPKTAAPALSDADTEAALAFLRDPHLLDRIVADFERCGVVGEHTNKLVGYLGAVSRKLDEPLAVIIQSSSAAGKSSLMEAVLAFVPEEERVKYSAMTGQSLFYMGETELAHKVLAIVEEEGAARASYALKILQSEGELQIASTGKDPDTGKLITHEYRVEGPVMIFLTTTAMEIDEELLNRCLVLTVDEDRGQTQAIHERQRAARELEGRLMKKSRDNILALHRNAQRLLRPLLVVNPYARRLGFPDHRTRTRRDHVKYLTLIETVALLHQHQRPIKTVEHEGKLVEYIEVTLDDVSWANRLAHQVLGRSLDELSPQTRRMLTLLDAHVAAVCAKQSIERKDFRFSRKEVREATGFGSTQTKLHLDRLVELEYVVVHRGANGTSYLYELVYDGKAESGGPQLLGLVDVAALADATTTRTFRGARSDLSGSYRPPVGQLSGTSRGGDQPAISDGEHGSEPDEGAKRASRAHAANGRSYAQAVP